MRSAKGPKPEPAHSIEVLHVARGELKPVLERRCRDHRIRQPESELPDHAAGAFGDGSVDRKLPKGSQELSARLVAVLPAKISALVMTE